MKQNTKEWLEWRSQGIGASDAPIIMGASPWKTPYKLWLEKTTGQSDFQGNEATERGHALEDSARQCAEKPFTAKGKRFLESIIGILEEKYRSPDAIAALNLYQAKNS